MRRSRQSFLGLAAVLFAVVPTVGVASVAVAQTDVTSTRATGTVENPGGSVLPGVTIAVNGVQDTLGGS